MYKYPCYQLLSDAVYIFLRNFRDIYILRHFVTFIYIIDIIYGRISEATTLIRMKLFLARLASITQ